MVTVENLSKSFGSQELFSGVSFNINQGERVGFVGRNGHGKTTLLRILYGEDHADSGEVSLPKGYSTGYVHQHIHFTSPTVIEEGCTGLPEHHADDRWKVEKILFGLGFEKNDMDRDPRDFSGGYQVRLNLTKVLVSEPNLLLLDEPTNYLDIVSIRWLENFLRQWPNELVLITHDRSFMDRVITHTLGIHRKKIRKIEGGTVKLYEQILKEEEVHEKTRLNDERKRKETELFISRFRAKARLAGMVQSRIKALEKQDRLDKLEKIKNLDFSFSYKPFNAKVLMSASGLSFAYSPNGPMLINDFSITIGSRDRICVIGKNGKGKTTLLKLLAGEIKPLAGRIEEHSNTKTGYFAQTNVLNLSDSLTIEDEIMMAGCERQRARDIAGAMMFEGDDALKPIGILSGGEKSRVLLGKILAGPCNLLFLDEPTNHLDMESCDALLAAIDDFDGAVIMVTHNELFLHTLATKFVVFQSNGAKIFDGSYQSFLDRVGWDEEDQQGKIRDGKENQSESQLSKNEIRKLRADILTRRSRELKPLETKIITIENEIISLEKELEQMTHSIVEASQAGNSKAITDLSKKIHDARTAIDTLFDDLERLTLDVDAKKKLFDAELAGLE